MFTTNMINGVMLPALQAQPAPIAASLHVIVAITTQHITLLNLIVAITQVEIGFLLLTGIWVRGAIITSIIWSLLVWYGGEGMSMLFTGEAGVLTGAPGAVLLYPLLGLLVYPRTASTKETAEGTLDSILPQAQFRWVFAGFWIFAALLQLQPYWWQPEQISQIIGDMIGQGGFNRFLVDPILQQFSTTTTSLELPLNIALIVIFLGLGLALLIVKPKQIRPLLAISIILSVVIWWIAQGFGMIFTGMATDFNSGLLLILMALACWPKASVQRAAQSQPIQDVKQPEGSARLA
jgi:hypothetical protein